MQNNIHRNLVEKIKRHWVIILLAIFVMFGGILRLYHLSSQSYWMDEGYTVSAIMSITEHGSTILDSGQNYSCPIYCYPTAFLVKLFGDSPATYRLLAGLAGILFIIVIYFIVKRLFNQKIALLSSSLITFSYWQIAWSRQARSYTLFTLLFWLALYFFHQSLYSAKRKHLNITLTIFFTMAVIFTHTLGYILPIIFISWILIEQIFFSKKIYWQTDLIIISFIMVIFWMFDYFFNITFFPTILTNLNFHYVLPYYLNFYLRNYWLFIFLAIITYFNKDNSHKKEEYFLLFIFFSYLIPLSFLTNIVHYRYLFHLTPIFFILGSKGFLNINTNFKNKTTKIIGVVIVLGLFIIFGGVFIPQTNYYLESDSPNTLGKRPYYAYTPQPNWNSAYAYIKENRKANEITISSQPQFNKIFLNEAGYWIKHNYYGLDNKTEFNQNDKEYYVGAEIIDDINEFIKITSNTKGFVVFDYQSTQNRIPQNILNYIKSNFLLVFNEKTNSFSEIWVYSF